MRGYSKYVLFSYLFLLFTHSSYCFTPSQWFHPERDLLLYDSRVTMSPVDTMPLPVKNLPDIDSVEFLFDSTGLEGPQDTVIPSIYLDTLPVDLTIDKGTISLIQDSITAIAVDSLTIKTELQDSIQRINESMRHKIFYLENLATRRLTIEMRIDSFREYKFSVCHVNPQRTKIELFNQVQDSDYVDYHTIYSINEYAHRDGKDILFAMNAGMYEPNRKAKGLFISNGIEEQEIDLAKERPGNFYMLPNGVFAIDTLGIATVLTTEEFQAHRDSAHFSIATQSGPMMLVDGQINPLFNDGSRNRHIRNAVGVTPWNEVIFVISHERVTFFEISSMLLSLGCEDALYLDGAISKAYFGELENSQIDSGWHRLGPIITIFKDQQSK